MSTEAKEHPDALEYLGRDSNKELGNFRLLGKSRHQQYFTPVELSDVIYRMLSPALPEGYDVKELSVLDPTCGSGRLLVPWKKAGSTVMGIELDKEAFGVAKKLLGKDNVRLGDILDYADKLHGFNVAVTNPPYGIYWQVEDRAFCFESTNYGDSIESQAATIEICTQALSWSGLLVAIIPSTTFTNAKDSKVRNHLYSNYEILLKATLGGVFKKEYGIDVAVDLVIAQRNYGSNKGSFETLELDIVKDFGWQQGLVEAMHRVIRDREIAIYPSKPSSVPHLERLKPIELSNSVRIAPKAVSGAVSAVAMLDFINSVVNEYNPVRGIETGLVDAYMSPSSLIVRGIDAGREMLSFLGFEAEIKDSDLAKLERLKEKYEHLCTPIYRPKPHQLLAYYYDKEYTAEATVYDKDGNLLFMEGSCYHLHPTWVRHKEVVKIDEAFDERTKKPVIITTEVDRGYLAIRVETQTGERVFNEIDVDEMKLLTDAFPLPVIEDIYDKHPARVEANMRSLEREFPFLFDYQKEDVARLVLKPFGYIGYEMGGGKTVTSASWAKLRGYKKVLVVCQSGLVNNWINELNKFGFKAKRLTTHRSVDKLVADKRGKVKPDDTVFYVTSYEFLSLNTGRVYDPWDCIEYDKDGNVRRSAFGNTSEKCSMCGKAYGNVVKECPKCESYEAWTGTFCHKCGYRAYTYTSNRKTYPAYKRLKKLFSAVIVDEAQMAKSKNTLRGRAVRALKPKGKLILTGTLMKGYVTDIYWNVGWLLGYGNPLFHYPYRGGSKQFLEEFGTFEYVTKQFEDTLHEGRGRMIPEVSNLNRFWRIMASFTIRRLKDDMVKLPEKKRNILLLPMDAEHEQVYFEYQSWASNAITKAMQNAEQNGGEVNMGVISAALWKLRFAATVPNAKEYLLDDKGPGVIVSNGSWNKIDRIVELVREIRRRDEKVIIFSGLRPMVSQIIKKLKAERIGFIPVLASHKTSQRFDMIQRFSDDDEVTAIVAGLNVLNRGFTITAANNVIITDIEYSPESIFQAEDRAHRTGQLKDVNIYYLFSQSTIDEAMYELVSKKQAAISNAIDANAVYKDVAELLEDKSGNIQLEVAKRVMEMEAVAVKNEPMEAEQMPNIQADDDEPAEFELVADFEPPKERKPAVQLSLF
jgi:predicted RNA methylase/superfamily II DNA or RNA helicase